MYKSVFLSIFLNENASISGKALNLNVMETGEKKQEETNDNKCGINAKASDRYKRNTSKWFVHRERNRLELLKKYRKEE